MGLLNININLMIYNYFFSFINIYMEKNSKKIIINNLQKTLNLLEQIDLTGGEILSPEELQNRVNVYLRTKEGILKKISQISQKLSLFKENYNNTTNELQRISELNSGREVEKAQLVEKNIELNTKNESLENSLKSWEEWGNTTYKQNQDLAIQNKELQKNMNEVDQDINEIGYMIQELARVINSP